MKVLFNISIMFTCKSRVIIGLTTYYNHNLMISLSGLSRLGRRAILIIHNDNPDTPITRRNIRRMGYEGELYIINSEHNIGMLGARLAIIDFVVSQKISAPWFVFADDDDILLNLDVPDIGINHFAVIQNMAVIRTRLIDVLRAMRSPDDIVLDNENVYLVRPHIGMAGTLVKTDAVIKLADMLRLAHSKISDIDESLTFRPPVDMMMWSALNIVARHYDETASPIYMDTLNYIATDIDTAPTKYGMQIVPQKNPQQQIMNAIAKYDAVIRGVLCAAPVGQETDAK